jgi:hypothetical protein
MGPCCCSVPELIRSVPEPFCSVPEPIGSVPFGFKSEPITMATAVPTKAAIPE